MTNVEYIPAEVLAANGPPELTARMYPTFRLMMGILSSMAHGNKPIIGKFEIPYIDKMPLSSIGERAGEFLQCAEAIAREILIHEQPELVKDLPSGEIDRLAAMELDKVPRYFEKAVEYMHKVHKTPIFDWPATMSFAKMKELKSRKKSAFSSNK